MFVTFFVFFFLPTKILSEASKHRLKAVHGDVLHYNMQLHIPEEYKTAWDDDKPKVHIIGNLPFNVATPLIIQWLRAISTQTNAWSLGRVPLTLTFQKEVNSFQDSDILDGTRFYIFFKPIYLCVRLA